MSAPVELVARSLRQVGCTPGAASWDAVSPQTRHRYRKQARAFLELVTSAQLSLRVALAADWTVPPPDGADVGQWRELQVLHGMADGLADVEIGKSIHLSVDTVKTYAKRLFKRLGARNRAHAVHLGHVHGLLKEDG